MSQSGQNSELAGWIESNSRPAYSSWPANGPFYGRMRIYIENPISVAPGGDTRRQLKFFIWHIGSAGSGNRVIGFLESGSNCGGTDTANVCFTLQRNINHYTDTATVSLPVGQWSNLQWSWRHGAVGTSYVKIWNNNNTEGNPTAQDLVLDGAGTWAYAANGYDSSPNIGNGANQGTAFNQDFIFRLMDFELDVNFDPNWYVSGDLTLSPVSTSNLASTLPRTVKFGNNFRTYLKMANMKTNKDFLHLSIPSILRYLF